MVRLKYLLFQQHCSVVTCAANLDEDMASIMGMQGMSKCKGEPIIFSKYYDRFLTAQTSCVMYTNNRAVNL